MKRFLMVLVCLTLLLETCACGQGTPAKQAQEALTWQEQYDLGIRYLSEGNYEEAIIAFTATIEIDSKRADGYEKLADAYVALGDSESAINILRQGAETIGDDTLFRDYIAELTAEVEQSPKPSSESFPEPTSGPRVERSDNSDGSYVLFYYDSEGNMAQYYDVAGHMTREEFYNPDGTLDRIYYYDAAGNGAYLEIYAQDGTLYSITYNDAAGNWPRVEFYNPDGTLNSYSLSYYNSVGHKTRWEDHDSDGTLSMVHYCDSAESVTRVEYYNPDGTMNCYSLHYYDEAGNKTRQEGYDAAGNLINTQTYK